MAFSENFIRKQLNHLKPFVEGSSLEAARRSQDAIGELMALPHKKEVIFSDQKCGEIPISHITPRAIARRGVILYLHGGGYTCGSLEYAKGFGSALADECKIHVVCVSYRLAPENPYPAALDDALCVYRYLIESGYGAKEIIFCGESAGGGLIYALALKLKEEKLPLPGGFLAISPWTDLTQSGESHTENREVDPSMSKERLDYFARLYAKDTKDPFVSPLFGDLSHLPPSLIFVGGDEVMRDDAKRLHEKLLHSSSPSRLVIAPRMWHAYPLYGLKEHHEKTFSEISSFLEPIAPKPRAPRWMKLDNAAKIFPASRNRHWSNIFRLSITLKEKIDPIILQSALEVVARRFPSIAVRMRRGLFWYYLEELDKAPEVRKDSYQPLMRMPFDDVRKCCFRVLYYENRIAAEFFHAVTDGTGGLIFLKTLAAEYLSQKKGISIPASNGVLDRRAIPTEEELEDSFLKNAGETVAARDKVRAFRVTGTPEPDRFLHLTCGRVSVKEVLSLAKKHGVTLTEFISAVLIQSISEIQNERVKKKSRQRSVRIQIPVNLRKLFPSQTLRNFVLTTQIGIDPRKGEYDFEEILKIVHHQMALTVNQKEMRANITVNVNSEKSLAVKLAPLFIKNFVMKLVFLRVGESVGCLSFSNLGSITLPEEMAKETERVEFIIGSQSNAPYNLGAASFGDELFLNMVRNTREPELERKFFTRLRALGLHVKIESNQR